MPHIPEKNALAKVTNIGGNSFLEERMASLEIYIWKLLNHSTVESDPKFIEFITLDKFECDLGSSKLHSLTSDIQESTVKITGKASNFIKSLWGGGASKARHELAKSD